MEHVSGKELESSKSCNKWYARINLLQPLPIQSLSLYQFQAWTSQCTSFACITHNWMPFCCLCSAQVYATKGNVQKENSYQVAFSLLNCHLRRCNNHQVSVLGGFLRIAADLFLLTNWVIESGSSLNAPWERRRESPLNPCLSSLRPSFLFFIVCYYKCSGWIFLLISCCLKWCYK